MPSVRIPARFNGPPLSGNGGYSCGALAAHVGPTARVRLHQPPPLDIDMNVQEGGDGQLEMYHGGELVGSAWPAELEMDVPTAPSLEAAIEASNRYVSLDEHDYPTCYVCGTERPKGDGLCLFPGPVDDWNLLACSWEPAADTLDDAGSVRPEIVWSALDCPGYFAAFGAEKPVTLLGELTADLLQDVPGEQPLVVYAWPLGREGRKAWAGTAIADAAGEVFAVSLSLWIILK